ncbi:MAG: trigger factor [Bacteroidales bacterium]|nr:trigger factor [Bacteroidales bacterium]
MNITKKDTGELTATFKIEVTEDDYHDPVNKTLKDYQRKANMPGFRPGKVPFGVINKMYGKGVLAEEVNKILSDSLAKYITDNKIEILGNPLPNTEKNKKIDFEHQTEFEFYFDIGISPKFDLNLSDKIKIDYYKIKVDDIVVDKYLNDLCKRYGKVTNPDKADEGDVVYGEILQLDNSGNILENGINNKTSIGLDYIKLKTVKNKFIGLKKGDKVVFNPLKATKSAIDTSTMLGISKEEAEKLDNDFQLTVEEISRVTPAEINKELFDMVYPHDNIKEKKQLREKIKNDAIVSFATESERQFMNNTIKKLIEVSEIKIPDEFMKRWLLESNKDKITKEQLDTQYDNYSETFKWQLIENKILTDHKIEVKEEDIKNHIREYFIHQMPQTEKNKETEKRLNEIVNSIMQNKEEVKKIYDRLLEKRLLDLFKSTLKLNNKNISYEEFVKLATKTN